MTRSALKPVKQPDNTKKKTVRVKTPPGETSMTRAPRGRKPEAVSPEGEYVETLVLERHKIRYTLFVTGPTDEELLEKTFGLKDRIVRIPGGRRELRETYLRDMQELGFVVIA